jgi:hypothetical protein
MWSSSVSRTSSTREFYHGAFQEISDIAYIKIDADPVSFGPHCSTGSIQAITDLLYG